MSKYYGGAWRFIMHPFLLSSVGQIQAHDAVVRLQDGRVGGKVGGGSRVRLNVDAPQLRVQAEGVERSFLTQQLDLVDDLCTSVVPDKVAGAFIRTGYSCIAYFCIILFSLSYLIHWTHHDASNSGIASYCIIPTLCTVTFFGFW